MDVVETWTGMLGHPESLLQHGTTAGIARRRRARASTGTPARLPSSGFLRNGRDHARFASLLRSRGKFRRTFDRNRPLLAGAGETKAPRSVSGPSDACPVEEIIELALGVIRPAIAALPLRVTEDWLPDTSLDAGDVVIIAPSAVVHNGDLVAASMTRDDGNMALALRRYASEDGLIRLISPCRSLASTLHHPSQVSILGKVDLIIRHGAAASDGHRLASRAAQKVPHARQ